VLALLPQRLTVSQGSSAALAGGAKAKKTNDEDAKKRERIVRRAAKEFQVRSLTRRTCPAANPMLMWKWRPLGFGWLVASTRTANMVLAVGQRDLLAGIKES